MDGPVEIDKSYFFVVGFDKRFDTSFQAFDIAL